MPRTAQERAAAAAQHIADCDRFLAWAATGTSQQLGYAEYHVEQQQQLKQRLQRIASGQETDEQLLDTLDAAPPHRVLRARGG